MKKYFTAFLILLFSMTGIAHADEILSNASKKINYGAGISRTWEYHFDLAFNTSSGTSSAQGDESAGLNITLGYNITSNFFFGVSTGYIHDFGNVKNLYKILEVDGKDTKFPVRGSSDIMPMLADLQYRWNPLPRFTVFVVGRGGLFYNTTPVKLAYSEKEKKNVDFTYPHFSYYELQPGIMVRPSKNIDVRFSAGYGYAKPMTEQEGFEGRSAAVKMLSFKLGVTRRFGKSW